jgi:hypothetical protein
VGDLRAHGRRDCAWLAAACMSACAAAVRPRRGLPFALSCAAPATLHVTSAALGHACYDISNGAELSCAFWQARALLEFGARTHLEPEAVRPLKKYALKWHMALGAALAASLALSRHPALAALQAL